MVMMELEMEQPTTTTTSDTTTTTNSASNTTKLQLDSYFIRLSIHQQQTGNSGGEGKSLQTRAEELERKISTSSTSSSPPLTPTIQITTTGATPSSSSGSSKNGTTFFLQVPTQDLSKLAIMPHN